MPVISSNSVLLPAIFDAGISREIKSWVTDAGGQVTHLGIAAPGSSEDDPVWSIVNFTYSVGAGINRKRLCEGTHEAKFIFTNYASYTYK